MLFNRQPSLHKLSIMSHRAKIRPWRTLRLNECACNPYNADFDGDEMNLHVPQTEEARTEAFNLMNVRHNLVTPRNGVPIIAAIQDFITASYLLSRKDKFFDRQQFTQICCYLADADLRIDIPPPAIHKPKQLWTGKQVFNVLIRPNKQSVVLVNLESKCKKGGSYPKNMRKDLMHNDGWLVIRNSEVMCGAMDKATVGDGNKNSVFGVILRDFGPEEAVAAMSRLAKLSARWLANQGFSLGINDVIASSELVQSKESLVDAAYASCDADLQMAKRGKLELLPGSDIDQTLESKYIGKLSAVREAVGDACLKSLSRHNAPIIMATCGSKGSAINVAQMVSCVGQQVIGGKRVGDGFQDRSLPHFFKKSREPPAKGFVRNSFFQGLTPTEFLFHAISGREGLVDTAVKTAETGYMSRRLMKALEDLTTHYDLSVRNAANGIVQFVYGSDGLDPVSMEGEEQPVDFERVWVHSRSTTAHSKSGTLLPFEICEIAERELTSAEFLQECTPHYLDTVRSWIYENLAKQAADMREIYGLYPALVREGGWDAETDLTLGAGFEEQAALQNKASTTIEQLMTFLKICWIKYVKSKIEPASTVGAVGAQSIGEPGTQMTLKVSKASLILSLR